MSKRGFKTRRIVFSALYLALALFAIIQAALSAKYSTRVSSVFTSFASFTIFGEEITEVTILKRTLSFDEFAGLMRKLVGHFGLFAAMGACGFFALYKVMRTKKVLLIDLSATFFIAVLTETIQSFVPTRAGLISDIVLDSQGATAAVSLIAAVISLKARIKRKRHKRLTSYVFALSLFFATASLIFSGNDFYTYFCFIRYISVCAVSLTVCAASDLL